MNHKIIEAQWRSFAERVVPRDASDIQRAEMRRAFFGGCAGFFRALEANDRAGRSAIADGEFMERIHQEITDFMREEKKAGR
jgi:hypothetical protein